MVRTVKLAKRFLILASIFAVTFPLLLYLLLHSKHRTFSTRLRINEWLVESTPNFRRRGMSDDVVIGHDTTRTAEPRPSCPKLGEKLVGSLTVDKSVIPKENNIQDDWEEKDWVNEGGTWKPDKCKAVIKVAVIIPYRQRSEQLNVFLHHIHPMLKRQLLDYRIFVVEQNGTNAFNRGMLFNIGFNESLKFQDFQCFIFHDVDLIPESDRNYYGCPTSPRHMSIAVDKFKYRLPYATILGGVVAFRKEHFEGINGFSNQFWGWGGEDDDLYIRTCSVGLNVTRPSRRDGRYEMLKKFHRSAKPFVDRRKKLKETLTRIKFDGLNSLKYDVVRSVELPLYTKITVDIDQKSTMHWTKQNSSSSGNSNSSNIINTKDLSRKCKPH